MKPWILAVVVIFPVAAQATGMYQKAYPFCSDSSEFLQNAVAKQAVTTRCCGSLNKVNKPLHQCDPVATKNWLTETRLTEKITAEGWTVSRMKKDGGCWEVYGNMPDGKRVEAYFHPETGEVLIISQRGTILYQAEN